MPIRIAMYSLLSCLFASSVVAQGLPDVGAANRPGASGWRSPSGASPVDVGIARYDNETPVATSTPGAPSTSPTTGSTAASTLGRRPTRAQVSKGDGTLPNQHGQVWRDYDISPYSLRIKNTNHPEQAIVDWILRETGYEAWHSTPLALLSADTRTLHVYHTQQMQAIVADIVDRFVNSQADDYGFGLRIITIRNPNWRARAMPLMKPIPVQSPGVQGWLLAREDAALLMSELRRRTDYREHNPPHQLVNNGQSLVVSSMRPRSYTKGIIQTESTWPGYQPELGQLDEGFSLEFSPLLSMDTRTVDAVVKLRLAQVEKILPVKLEVPTSIAPNQRTEVQVPQMTMLELHERFHWPTDQVLLLSLGVVATPGPKKPNMFTDALPLPKSPPRADALLFVESKGRVTATVPGRTAPSATASLPQKTYHGRY